MSLKKIKVIELEGLNFERLLHFLTQNKIVITNLKRKENNILQFNILESDYLKARRIGAFKNHIVKDLRNFGAGKYAKAYMQYIGLAAGVLLSVLCFLFLSAFTFNINIQGLNQMSKSEILSFLRDNNIKAGKINRASNHEIELMLKNEFEGISLVSVIKQGTNIIVNIKEKEHVQEVVYAPIVAQQNMIITNLVVNQGTAVKRIGDIVRRGEIVVEPFMKSENGEKINCQPIAKLECDEWHIGLVEFENEKTVNERTKNKLTHMQILFNEKVIYSKNQTKEANFAFFEEEIKEQYVFKQYFLPIKIKKYTIYELKQRKIVNDFNIQKDKLIKSAKVKAYSSITNKDSVVGEDFAISTQGGLTIIQYSVRVAQNYEIS